MMRYLLIYLHIAAAMANAIEIIAHRGFSARAPENTVAAFELAWKSKADACELDIHLTADQQIAVIHDRDTERTTGTKLSVAKSNWADLAGLDAGSWKDRAYTGEKIPTLKQALATLPKGSRRFFIEIKCGPEIVPVLRNELASYEKKASQLAVISFNKEATAATKKAIPWLKVYQLSGAKNSKKQPVDLTALITETKAAGLDGLDLGLDWPWSPEMVSQIRAASLGVFAYTINKPADVRKLATIGVDGITTDDPTMVRATLALQ